MNWEALGAFGELVGAAAVVATLIYFSRQLRQGSSNIRANSYQSASQGRTTFRMSVVQSKEVMHLFRIGLNDPDSLDEDDLLRFHVIMVEEFRIAQSSFFLQQRGLADPEFWDHERFMIETYKKAPAFNTWWADSRGYFSKEFVDYVDSASSNYAFAMDRTFGVSRGDQPGAEHDRQGGAQK